MMKQENSRNNNKRYLNINPLTQTKKTAAFKEAGNNVAANVNKTRPSFSLICTESINGIDAQTWDALFQQDGNGNHANLQRLETIFGRNRRGTDNQWLFRYFMVKDDKGAIVLAAYYTVAKIEPAFISNIITPNAKRGHINQNISEAAVKVVLLGSPLSRGQRLFLNREHTNWKTALGLLINQMRRVAQEKRAARVMLGDFIQECDEELKAKLFHLGMQEMELDEACFCDDLNWKDDAAYLSQLGEAHQLKLTKKMGPYKNKFQLSSARPQSVEEIMACYNMIQHNKEDVMSIEPPLELLQALNTSDEYDILRLYAKEDKDLANPIAVICAFTNGIAYNLVFSGIDASNPKAATAYQNLLYQAIQRAKKLGCTKVDLAAAATLVKQTVGIKTVPSAAFVDTLAA